MGFRKGAHGEKTSARKAAVKGNDAKRAKRAKSASDTQRASGEAADDGTAAVDEVDEMVVVYLLSSLKQES